MPAVECSDLLIRYGTATAVDMVSLGADRGEVVALLGPNGAGKTSTIETLEGYRTPDAGEVRVLGLDPRAQHRTLVTRVGVMPQRGGVYPMLGPRRVMELFAGYYADPEPVGTLLELVGLQGVERTPWRHLSGGEQQRLSFALALVGRPEAVFLDEPTAGVDPEGRIALRGLISGLKDRGTCVVLTTHELAEAEKLADRMVILHAGRVLAQGTTEELAAVRGSALVRFSSRPNLDTADLASVLGTGVSEGDPGSYNIDAAASPPMTAALAAWLAEHDAELFELRTTATLEETYLALVGAEAAGPAQLVAASFGGRRTRGRRGR
jgi:ABC-2 type transport system ATP-binding protein